MLIQARVNPVLSYHIDPVVMENFRKQLPSCYFDESMKVDHEAIDIIIGGDYLYQCMVNERRVIGSLILESTQFEWAISGVVQMDLNSKRAHCHIIADISDQLQKIFEIEDVDAISAPQSESEEIESHFKQNIRCQSNGKLSVNMPYKRSKSEVANMQKMAMAALVRNEKYLSTKNQQLYRAFVQEYLDTNHMELIPLSEINNSPSYYLPYHTVLRPSSVVFNASVKGSTGCSLNEALMDGPVIQPDLFTCLIKFRRYPVTISADISKMYRCI